MTISTTMAEIDDDIMEKAEEAFNKAVDPCFERPTLVIARAIQAARNDERERCAKIAASATQYEEGRDIATAIREGK